MGNQSSSKGGYKILNMRDTFTLLPKHEHTSWLKNQIPLAVNFTTFGLQSSFQETHSLLQNLVYNRDATQSYRVILTLEQERIYLALRKELPVWLTGEANKSNQVDFYTLYCLLRKQVLEPVAHLILAYMR